MDSPEVREDGGRDFMLKDGFGYDEKPSGDKDVDERLREEGLEGLRQSPSGGDNHGTFESHVERSLQPFFGPLMPFFGGPGGAGGGGGGIFGSGPVIPRGELGAPNDEVKRNLVSNSMSLRHLIIYDLSSDLASLRNFKLRNVTLA